jgi:acyl carrier protein
MRETPIDDSAIRSTVIARLGEVSPEVDPDGLDPAVSFRDQMDFDSIDFLNLILALERELGLKIPESDYPRLSSLDGCTRYLCGVLAPGEATGEASPGG